MKFVPSDRNKVKLLRVPGHSGIQSNEDADALARKG
jgi:ribonuclease HI